MSLNPSDGLQRRLAQFWEFTERATAEGDLSPEPLFRVRENWEYWWETELSRTERQEIEQLVAGASNTEQESFIKWVKGWIGQRCERRGAGCLVLAQLAHMSLFQPWTSLRPYCGVNALILQPVEGSWSIEDIKPLAVTVVGKGSDDFRHLLNLEMNEASRRDVWEVVLSVLSGMGLMVLLLLWGLVGWKPRRRWVNTLLLGGWVLVGGVLVFLLIGPPLADNILLPTLWVLVIVPFLLVTSALIANSREGFRAWRQGQKWARLLQQSQLCVLAGGVETGTVLEVKGPSFGVSLYLGILLALYNEDPDIVEQSLWRQFFNRLVERLPHWSFTGELRGSGWLKRVKRVPDKIGAMGDHPDITDAVTPVQKDARLGVERRTQPITSPAACVGQADGESQLRLHRCWHIAQVILAVGGFVSRWSVVGNLIMALLFATVCVALPDAYSISSPPSPPELAYFQRFTGERPPSARRFLDGTLLLTFRTSTPGIFHVHLRSDYWQDKVVDLGESDAGPGYVDAWIPLVKRPKAKESPQGKVEIRHPRRFLFCPLPERIVFEMPVP